MTDKKVRSLVAKLGHKDAMVQLNAASALGRIRDPRAVPALIEALDDRDLDTSARTHIIESLWAIRDPQAIPAFLRALRNKDVEIRIQAAVLLGTWKREAAVPALIAALKDKASAVTKYAYGDNGSNMPLLTQWVCNEAAIALGKIGDARAVPALSEACRNESYHIHTRGCAIRALAAIGDPLAVRSLIEALDKVEALDDAKYGKEAVKALAMIGAPAVPALLEVLSPEKSRSVMIPALIEILGSDEDLLPRCRAAELLRVIAEHQPAPALRAALPILRRNHRLHNRRHRDPVFKEALERIEAATATSRDLPLPAAAPPPDAGTLPRPAADVPPGAPVAPLRGFWMGLRRRLKSP